MTAAATAARLSLDPVEVAVGLPLGTVGEVEEFFARVCFEADQRLGEPAACRWFLNWFDDTPREDILRELLAEVDAALAARLLALRNRLPDDLRARHSARGKPKQCRQQGSASYCNPPSPVHSEAHPSRALW